MSSSTNWKRLDEILISEGLITEEQIQHALTEQQEKGGKLGCHLLLAGHIDEAGLVTGLTKQFGCEGVVLANREIPEVVLKLIPKKIAVSRKVLPFDYDLENNVVLVACESPDDEDLLNELRFVMSGKKVKTYIAAELSLHSAIAQHYLGLAHDDAESLLTLPGTENEPTNELSRTTIHDLSAVTKGRVMIVTDDLSGGEHLRGLLTSSGCEVEMIDSADDAIDLIDDRIFEAVLIKDTVPGDYIDLIDRLRKTSPQTVVRYYESESSLIMEDKELKSAGDLLTANLELFVSLLSINHTPGQNHSGLVGQYVNRLCRRLHLPEKERLLIVDSAYLHDLAKFYYSTDNLTDDRAVIQLTIKLLQSLNYSPMVIETLRSMYINLGGKYKRRLPIEALGGNIITAVDLFCSSIVSEERLTMDKVEAIKSKFTDLTGKLFLPEVAEAFIQMIQDDVLQNQANDKATQVMIYSRQAGPACHLEIRLKQEGFSTVSATSTDGFFNLYKRRRPDVVLLFSPGDSAEVTSFIRDLAHKGLELSATPTFTLVDEAGLSDLTGVLDLGVEDVIKATSGIELLVSKLQKIASRLNQSRLNKKNDKGSSGRLADIDMVDLLQALGPSRKTAKITVTSTGREDTPLIMYMDAGQIIHAVRGKMYGPEAIYCEIASQDGTWTVEPIKPEDIPPPNNELSNDELLIEGCRLLDETNKSQLFSG